MINLDNTNEKLTMFLNPKGLLPITGPDKFDDLSPMLPSLWSSIDLNSPSGPAFLNLLTTIGSSLPESPYILESLIRDIDHYPNVSFHVQLLNSTVALFLKRPAECQGMLTRLFKTAMKFTEQSEVRERAEFLFQLLKYDIEAVKINLKHVDKLNAIYLQY